MRVVSLLPSATELLCAAGGEALLIGRSHECDYPLSITDRPILTGQKTHAAGSAAIDQHVRTALHEVTQDAADRSLYTLDIALLRELGPDVILTQDLCEVCSIDLNAVRAVAAGMNPQPKIISLNPMSIEDVFDSVLTIGEAIGRGDHARRAVVKLRERYWSAVDYVNPYVDGPEIAFLEWMDPLFVGGHWTPQLILAAGGRHSLNPPGAKSRRIEPVELVESMPQRLIICPCGFSFDEIHRDLPALKEQKWWPTLPVVMDGRVVLVDGNAMFNRPGPRLVDAFRWLVAWINDRPEVAPDDFPVQIG